MFQGNRNDFSRTSMTAPSSSRDGVFPPAPPGVGGMMPPTAGLGVGATKLDAAHSSIATLQTYARKLNVVAPTYAVDRVGGQDHAPVFRAIVSWNGRHMTCQAIGNSKNEARRSAAVKMIEILHSRGVFVNGLPPNSSNPYDRDRNLALSTVAAPAAPYVFDNAPNPVVPNAGVPNPVRQAVPIKPENFPLNHPELQSHPCNPGIDLQSAPASFAHPGSHSNSHHPMFPGGMPPRQEDGRHLPPSGRHPGSHSNGSGHHPGAVHPGSNHSGSRSAGPDYRVDSSAASSGSRLLEVPIPRAKQEPYPAEHRYPPHVQDMPPRNHPRDGPPPRHHRDGRAPPHSRDSPPMRHPRNGPPHNPRDGPPLHHSRNGPPPHSSRDRPPHHPRDGPPPQHSRNGPPSHSSRDRPPHNPRDGPPPHHPRNGPPHYSRDDSRDPRNGSHHPRDGPHHPRDGPPPHHQRDGPYRHHSRDDHYGHRPRDEPRHHHPRDGYPGHHSRAGVGHHSRDHMRDGAPAQDSREGLGFPRNRDYTDPRRRVGPSSQPPPTPHDRYQRRHSAPETQHNRMDTEPSKAPSRQCVLNGLTGGTIIASGHRSSSNSVNSHSRPAVTGCEKSASGPPAKPSPQKPLVIPKIPASAPAPAHVAAKPAPSEKKNKDPRLALRRRPKQDAPSADNEKITPPTPPPAAAPSGALEETDLSSGNAAENSYHRRSKENAVEKVSASPEKKKADGAAVQTSPVQSAARKLRSEKPAVLLPEDKNAAEIGLAKNALAETQKLIESIVPAAEEPVQNKSKAKEIVPAVEEPMQNKDKKVVPEGSIPLPDDTAAERKTDGLPLRLRQKSRFRVTAEKALEKEKIGKDSMQIDHIGGESVQAGKEMGAETKIEKGGGDAMIVETEADKEVEAEKVCNGKPNGAVPTADGEVMEDGEIEIVRTTESPTAMAVAPAIAPSARVDRQNDAKQSSLRFGRSEALKMGDSRLVVPAKKRPRADHVVPTRVFLWVFCDSREEQVLNLLRAVTFGLYSELELSVYVFGNGEINLQSSEKVKVFRVPVPSVQDGSSLDLQVAMGFEAGRHSRVLDQLREDNASGHGSTADLKLSRIVILSSQPGFANVANENTDVVKARNLRSYVKEVHRQFCEANGGDATISGNTGEA